MSSRRLPNPFRASLLWIGYALARFGLLDRHRARRITDLSWPRIVTGIARMSKTAADVAMVGIAIGTPAIAGISFAGPYWGLAFVFGGGFADGSIGPISQRFGANRWDELELAVKSSAVVIFLISLPITVFFVVFAEPLIAILGARGTALELGTAYLSVVAFAIPFAGLNLIASRTLIGADDAWTPMMVRAGGAVANIGLNAVFIFGLDLGVVGAALGTVFANVLVLLIFTIGFIRGAVPGIGPFPVVLSTSSPYVDRSLARDVIEISTPLVLSNGARSGAQFPMIAIVATFGEPVLAAYEIARRVRSLLDTPGWGFSLASSSLVGQSLGVGDESTADAYGREIVTFALAVYAIGAVVAFIFAGELSRVFVADSETLPIAEPFVQVAALSVLFWGIEGAATGPLRASGDTRWPFYGRLLGLYAFAIPLVYLGSVTMLGIYGIYLAIVSETVVPATVTYYRFRTGRWKEISRRYRPDVAFSAD